MRQRPGLSLTPAPLSKRDHSEKGRRPRANGAGELGAKSRTVRHMLRSFDYSWPKKGTPLRPRLGVNRTKSRYCSCGLPMSFEDDLRRVEKHVAEARRIVQRQKGLIVRLRAAAVNTLDAQRILWLLESNLRRFEQHRDHLRGDVRQRR